MSVFTGPLQVEHGGAKWRLWTLLQNLPYEADFEGSGRWIVVPLGFVTDGATIPRIAWWLFPATGSYMRAAALHDYLLTLLSAGTPHPHASTWAECDAQFLEAMRACGTGWITRHILWAAVRIYGLLRRR